MCIGRYITTICHYRREYVNAKKKRKLGIKSRGSVTSQGSSNKVYRRIRAQHNTRQKSIKPGQQLVCPFSSEVRDTRFDCRHEKQVIIAYTKVTQLTKNYKKDNLYVMGYVAPYGHMPQLIKRINHIICLGPTSSAGQMRMKRWDRE